MRDEDGNFVGDAERLIGGLYHVYGPKESNAAIWYLLQDDSHDIVDFLSYMEASCSWDVASACAKFLEDFDELPELSSDTIEQLFREGDS